MIILIIDVKSIHMINIHHAQRLMVIEIFV